MLQVNESSDQLAAQYRDNGFCVAERALSPSEVSALIDEAMRLCREEAMKLTGADAASGETDDMARFLAIHFPHKISPLMRETLAHPRIVEILTRAIGPNIKCMQSMLFIKHAGKPGQAWHQDEDFIPTRDRSLGAAWIALDDATIDNGCLWVIPGSHRAGILWPLRQHSNPEYDSIPESFDFPYRETDAIAVEVPAGSIVFFHGYLLHKSLKNRRSAGFRRALVNHYMSAESLLPWWHSSGVAPPTHDNRDIVLIAGSDPYAWKGIEERNRPYVRRETPANNG
jgi:ectoine hydroxylase-related dioxygenase (phytanoyl-CoA dioxygenase family)